MDGSRTLDGASDIPPPPKRAKMDNVSADNIKNDTHKGVCSRTTTTYIM